MTFVARPGPVSTTSLSVPWWRRPDGMPPGVRPERVIAAGILAVVVLGSSGVMAAVRHDDGGSASASATAAAAAAPVRALR